MNTKVTVTSAYKSSDHLIILSDSSKISGFSSFLGKTEIDFLKNAAQKEVPYVIFPNQANRGTHLNVSGVAMTASAPNKPNAIKLVEFLSSPLAQQMYAEQDAEYPRNVRVGPSGFLKSLRAFRADELSLAKIAEHRGDASKLVDAVDYNSN